VRAWLISPISMDSAEATLLSAVAARLLGTELAFRDRLPDAPQRLEELDSLLQLGPARSDQGLSALFEASEWGGAGVAARGRIGPPGARSLGGGAHGPV